MKVSKNKIGRRYITMRYEILGETLPVVVCQLEGGEKMITEGGGMSWMSPNMLMETTTSWESIRKDVLRREDVPERLYCTGRQWYDRICIQFSGVDQGV